MGKSDKKQKGYWQAPCRVLGCRKLNRLDRGAVFKSTFRQGQAAVGKERGDRRSSVNAWICGAGLSDKICRTVTSFFVKRYRCSADEVLSFLALLFTVGSLCRRSGFYLQDSLKICLPSEQRIFSRCCEIRFWNTPGISATAFLVLRKNLLLTEGQFYFKTIPWSAFKEGCTGCPK